jgi:broad-specificity NMP kinase
VDPEREVSAMEAALMKENEEFKNELYSYYINIKNVFVLYCNEWEGSERLSSRGGSGEDNRDNIS